MFERERESVTRGGGCRLKLEGQEDPEEWNFSLSPKVAFQMEMRSFFQILSVTYYVISL